MLFTTSFGEPIFGGEITKRIHICELEPGQLVLLVLPVHECDTGCAFGGLVPRRPRLAIISKAVPAIGESFSKMGLIRLSIIAPSGSISFPGIRLLICSMSIIHQELAFLNLIPIAPSSTLRRKKVKYSPSFYKSSLLNKNHKITQFLMRYSLQESHTQVNGNLFI